MDIIMVVSFCIIAFALVALAVVNLVSTVASLKMTRKALKTYNRVFKKFEPYIDKMIDAMEDEL